MSAAVKSFTLRNGTKMPCIGLGTWGSPSTRVHTAVTTAIENGYRHIDCAHDYENESEVGDGIKEILDKEKICREDIFITSKLWTTFFSPERVKQGFEESRKNLKLNYLDLYLMHFPFAMKQDDVTDGNYEALNDESIDYVDTWREFIKLKEAGLVKAIGVSNFNQYQIERLSKETSCVPDVHQFECHPYLDQTSLVTFCQSKGIIVTGFSPLGSPGNRDLNEPILFKEPLLQKIAESYKKDIAQILLRYQIQRNVAIIPKSVTPSRIISNFQVFDFELSDDEMSTIKSLNRDFRTCDVDGWASRKHKYYPFRKDYTE